MLLRGDSPVCNGEVGHLGKVADIARDHSEVIDQRYSCNTEVLRTNADTLLAQLPHAPFSFFRKGENIPPGKVVDSAHKGCMPLRELGGVIAVPMHIGQPALQLFFNSNGCSEQAFTWSITDAHAEDRVSMLVVRYGVGVEDEHRLVSFSLRTMASTSS